MPVPGVIPYPELAKTEAVLTYLGQFGTITDSLTTISFGSVTLPSSALVIVGYAGIGTNSQTVSSVSIGGSNGTIHASNGAAGTRKRAFASRVCPAGSTAIAVTLSGSNGTSSSHGVGVWALTGYGNAAPQGAAGNDGNAASLAITHNQVNPGFSVYACMDQGGGSATLSTAQIVNYQAADGNARRFTYAMSKRVLTQTPHTETLTIGSANNIVIMGGSWTPAG